MSPHPDLAPELAFQLARDHQRELMQEAAERRLARVAAQHVPDRTRRRFLRWG